MKQRTQDAVARNQTDGDIITVSSILGHDHHEANRIGCPFLLLPPKLPQHCDCMGVSIVHVFAHLCIRIYCAPVQKLSHSRHSGAGEREKEDLPVG